MSHVSSNKSLESRLSDNMYNSDENNSCSDGDDATSTFTGTEQDGGDDIRSRLTQKKKRKSREPAIDADIIDKHGKQIIEPRLWDVCFPNEYEASLASAIFELGLKESSPKVLMALMPGCVDLSTEHLKSHLQKYRIHHERSKEEFLVFFNEFMRESFSKWKEERGWEKILAEDNDAMKRDKSEISLYSEVGAESSASTDASVCHAFMDMHQAAGSSASTAPGAGNSSPITAKRPKVQSLKHLTNQSQQLLNEWKSIYGEIAKESDRIGGLKLDHGLESLSSSGPSRKESRGRDRGSGKRDSNNSSSSHEAAASKAERERDRGTSFDWSSVPDPVDPAQLPGPAHTLSPLFAHGAAPLPPPLPGGWLGQSAPVVILANGQTYTLPVGALAHVLPTGGAPPGSLDPTQQPSHDGNGVPVAYYPADYGSSAHHFAAVAAGSYAVQSGSYGPPGATMLPVSSYHASNGYGLQQQGQGRNGYHQQGGGQYGNSIGDERDDESRNGSGSSSGSSNGGGGTNGRNAKSADSRKSSSKRGSYSNRSKNTGNNDGNSKYHNGEYHNGENRPIDVLSTANKILMRPGR